MSIEDEPEAEQGLVIKKMRGFLANGASCRFAALAAKAHERSIQWLVRPGLAGVQDAVGTFFAGAARLELAAGVVFPSLRSSMDVVAMLAAFAADLSWTVSLVDWTEYPRPEILVSLLWQTPAGDQTSVMGMAPFGSMPASRRAPFVSLIAWPGGRLNEFRALAGARARVKSGHVGFLDMPTQDLLKGNEDTYRTSWDQTRAETKQLRHMLQEGAMRPEVSFCLSQRCREPLMASLRPAS